MPDALELLKTRRSLKPVELTGPGPSDAEIDTLLTIASRVPDHGKLTPWRFIVFTGDARLKAGEAIVSAFRAMVRAHRHSLAFLVRLLLGLGQCQDKVRAGRVGR